MRGEGQVGGTVQVPHSATLLQLQSTCIATPSGRQYGGEFDAS